MRFKRATEGRVTHCGARGVYDRNPPIQAHDSFSLPRRAAGGKPRLPHIVRIVWGWEGEEEERGEGRGVRKKSCSHNPIKPMEIMLLLINRPINRKLLLKKNELLP